MTIHKILWGFFILGLGVMLLLTALGIGQDYEVVRIIASALLLGITISNLIRLNLFIAVFPLAVILYIWRIHLGFPDMDLRLLLLATALLGIGLSIIFYKKNYIYKRFKHTDKWHKSENSMSEDEFVHIDSSFGEQTKYIHSSDLKKVNISSNFSSVKVYFDQCRASDQGLNIQVSGNFSGIVLTMPRSWSVENKVNTFAANVTERDTDPNNTTKVILSGSLNFAEIKIVHV